MIEGKLMVEALRDEDREELLSFYRFVIEDTVVKDGIKEVEAVVQEEMEGIVGNLEHYLQNKGELLFYLVGKFNQQIAGAIGLGTPNKIIAENLKAKLSHVKEIKNVYVHPDFQGQGIGRMLFEVMLKIAKTKKANEICLDCGYRNSQGFWKKLLGNPQIVLENYWDPQTDHLIWRMNIDAYETKRLAQRGSD